VREWRGRTHLVCVVDGGFEYGGKTFPSLTAIAVEITRRVLVGAEVLWAVLRRGSEERRSGGRRVR
jgi:Protein of unknown function (DUF2924)